MGLTISHRLLTIFIALLLVVLIGLLIRIFSDLQLDSDQASRFSLANSNPTEAVQGTDTINKKDSAQDKESEPLELQAICSGEFLRIDADSCRDRFEGAGRSLSLGETITFVTSVGNRRTNLEFSINNSSDPIIHSDIDSAVSRLKVDSVHSVRVRRFDGKWSNQLNFQVSLQPPGKASIADLCADLRCASNGSLVAPSKPPVNAFYPLIEHVLGLSRPPTEHMWIELMLDFDGSFLGCLNCQAAQATEIVYPNRKEFGASGIFYNWDVTELSAGNHSLRARLRNKLYAGQWSSEFIFVVQRP